jgi:Uma2 family endonuclease
MPVATTPPITLDGFTRLNADGAQHELNAGELITMPPAKSLHTRIARAVLLLLESFLKKHANFEAFAEAGFVLSADPLTIRQPDVSLLRKERIRATEAENYFGGAPDLAVEVISPTDLAEDIATKVRQYLAAGSHQAWVLYPKTQEVHLFRPNASILILDRDQTIDGNPPLPGFSVKVADLFAI